MIIYIRLGNDARETLATLASAYQSLEQLSYTAPPACSRDLSVVLSILNTCLTAAAENIPSFDSRQQSPS